MTDLDDELYVMPKRKWKGDEPAPGPVIHGLVSSRDGRGDPAEVSSRSAAWRAVRRTAEKAGWTVRVTYALVWKSDVFYLNGNPAKAAHHVHSVALRVARGAVRGFGVWWVESTGPEVPAAGWSFDVGQMRGPGLLLTSLNLTEFKAALT